MDVGVALPEDGWLERLVGLRSSKPTYYAQWRGEALAMARAVEAMQAVTASMGATTQGPAAVCARLVEGLATHFAARQAGVCFLPGRDRTGSLGVTVYGAAGGLTRTSMAGLARLEQIEEPVRQAVRAVLSTGHSLRGAPAGSGTGRLLALPLSTDGTVAGALFLVWPGSDSGSEADMQILETLAQHSAAMVENACLYKESALRYEQLRRADKVLAVARREQLLAHERQRIARELHDTVAQHLVGIGMNLEWCRRHPDGVPSEVATRLGRSQSLARTALGQIRGAIFELTGPERDTTPVGAALRALCRRMSVPDQLACAVEVAGPDATLTGDVAEAVLGVAREALYNVVRHSGARNAWVRLSVGSLVRLTVSDDGGGDPAVVRRFLTTGGRRTLEHHGVANMCTRVREVGGTVRVSARRSGGIRLTATIPLTDAALQDSDAALQDSDGARQETDAL